METNLKTVTSDPKLNNGARLLYAYLADFNADGNIPTSLDRLSRASRVCRLSTSKAIKSLVNRGYISVSRIKPQNASFEYKAYSCTR
jgi:hypothetical protein